MFKTGVLALGILAQGKSRHLSDAGGETCTGLQKYKY